MNYENWADSKPDDVGKCIVLRRKEAFKWENILPKHEHPFLCSQGKCNTVTIMRRIMSPFNTFLR